MRGRSLSALLLSVVLGTMAAPAVAQQPVARPVDAGSADHRAQLARGAKLFAKCQACHTLEPRGRNKVGPRLHGLFGRLSGSVPDYHYSEALKRAKVVWNSDTLDVFLAGTTEMVPGTKMYAGIARREDRAALIAFLKEATGDGAAMPARKP